MVTPEEMNAISERTGISFRQKGDKLIGDGPRGPITITVYDTGGMVRLRVNYLGESVTQGDTVNRQYLVREIVRMTRKFLYIKKNAGILDIATSLRRFEEF